MPPRTFTPTERKIIQCLLVDASLDSNALHDKIGAHISTIQKALKDLKESDSIRDELRVQSTALTGYRKFFIEVKTAPPSSRSDEQEESDGRRVYQRTICDQIRASFHKKQFQFLYLHAMHIVMGGRADIIIEVYARHEHMELLSQFVIEYVRRLKGVRETHTAWALFSESTEGPMNESGKELPTESSRKSARASASSPTDD